MEEDEGMFLESEGVFVPRTPIEHRGDDYEEFGHDILIKMQRNHFWYWGRFRFLLNVLRRELPRIGRPSEKLSVVDFGGGCGGWIEYLNNNKYIRFGELALADSSLRALTLADPVVGAFANRYQVDILNLRWKERWDVAFMLDVLEHIPQDEEALRQIHHSLRPGGLLFVAVPALRAFWTYYDDLVHHRRRYSRRDFSDLADATGFRLITSRYFMFFLGSLLWFTRMRPPNLAQMSEADIEHHLDRIHRIPIAPINLLLRAVFSLETPLGVWVPFPWGTSVLGVFQKT